MGSSGISRNILIWVLVRVGGSGQRSCHRRTARRREPLARFNSRFDATMQNESLGYSCGCCLVLLVWFWQMNLNRIQSRNAGDVTRMFSFWIELPGWISTFLGVLLWAENLDSDWTRRSAEPAPGWTVFCFYCFLLPSAWAPAAAQSSAKCGMHIMHIGFWVFFDLHILHSFYMFCIFLEKFQMFIDLRYFAYCFACSAYFLHILCHNLCIFCCIFICIFCIFYI